MRGESFQQAVDAAASVLSQYGITPATASIAPPPTARGFSGALILRVQTDDRSYCLRRWPGDGLPQQRLRGLHRFLQYLAESGIDQISVPLSDSAGQSLIESDGRLWQLEPWMPGTADFHELPTPERLRSAMQTLARLHLAAREYVCPPSGRKWFDRHSAAPSPACGERLNLLRDWTPSRQSAARTQLSNASSPEFSRVAREVLELFEVARRPVERELVALQYVPFLLHPCLRDVWHDHLLFTGDELTGLIDPSAARTENVAADLSRLLRSLVPEDRGWWDVAMTAYGDIRPLSMVEYQLLGALDRSGVALSGMTWIDRFVSGRLREDELPRVVVRLESIRDRLTQLVDWIHS